MTDWILIRVVLHGGAQTVLAHPPGRVLLAHAEHTFADLAEAVDVAFARWDLTPLHEFTVEGRRLVSQPELAAEGDDDAEPSDEVTVGEVGLRAGSRFSYLFDPGEGWVHECVVEAVGVNPYEAVGAEPEAPVPVFGWGTVPDQYGRLHEDDEEDEEEAADAAAGEDAGLVGWVEAEAASWEVVAEAIEGIDRPRDDEALKVAAAALRAGAGVGGETQLLWSAAGLDPPAAPPEDEQLWLDLAAAVIAPRGHPPLTADAEAAWAALEPADWAGAVIELVRGGPGASAAPEDLVALVQRCPEVEGDDLGPEDVAVLVEGFTTVVALWRLLGAVDEDGRLTGLGHWGLPEALRRAWAGQQAG